jgi:indolepyruvate ferredoxin oxidoreductase beta subunit
MLAGIPIHMSEIHGMAQRGGVVESALVFGNARSSIISDGEADVLLSFEPSEALRALGKCNSGTVVITNLTPIPPFTVAIGKGVYPAIDKIQTLLQAKTAKLIAFDAAKLALQAGNILAVNMVLTGALLQTGILPLSVEPVIEAIRSRTKPAFVETNLKAFHLGFAAAKAATSA